MSSTRVWSPILLRLVERRFAVQLSVAATIAILTILTVPSTNAMAATVTLSPGDSIQNAVNANPAGTTFDLTPGVYRNQSVSSLHTGDSFIGEAGAILDGANVLTGWTQVSISGVFYWTTAGGTPLPSPACNNGTTLSGAAVPCCLETYPGCMDVQNLYVNDIEYQHVTSLANVVAGASWYYDYTGTDGGVLNNVYLAEGDTPNSDTVELGDTTNAFASTAANITIKNLIIEKYAAPTSSAAVQIEGPDWLIQNNEVRLNHGIGISAKYGGNDVQVLGNNVHNNGEFGVGGPGDGGLWDSNTIAYNNADGNYEGGGSKFTGSNVTISNNVAHDNNGPGLWTDDGGTYNTYEGNTAYNNNGNGIRYEISRYGTITNNTVYGNIDNVQITYTGSDHGRISGNIVTDEGHTGIGVVNTVGSRGGTVYQVTDTQVTGNTISISSTGNDVVIGLLDHAQPSQPGIYTDPTNFFDYNMYQFSGSVRPSWLWGEVADFLQPISWSSWQAAGQDLHGTIQTDVPAANQ
jgi:parallel beta-helix repeat protein